MLRAAYAAANLRHQAAIERLAALPPPRSPPALSPPSIMPLPPVVPDTALPPMLLGPDADSHEDHPEAEEAEWAGFLAGLLPEGQNGPADAAAATSLEENEGTVIFPDGGWATALLTDVISTVDCPLPQQWGLVQQQLQQLDTVDCPLPQQWGLVQQQQQQLDTVDCPLPQQWGLVQQQQQLDIAVSSAWGRGRGETGAGDAWPLPSGTAHLAVPGDRLWGGQMQQQGGGGGASGEGPQQVRTPLLSHFSGDDPYQGPQPLFSQYDDRLTAGACNLEALLDEMDSLAEALQVNGGWRESMDSVWKSWPGPCR